MPLEDEIIGRNKDGSMNEYEYDYVKVGSNKITEWRKFHYEVSQQVVRDDSHPTFDSYKDDVTYQTGNLKWYKNNKLKKVHDISNEDNLLFARELFTLGLNSSDIKKESYFANDGVKDSKISEMYKSFSQVFGKDLIYALITASSADDGGGDEDIDVASLRFYFQGTENTFDNYQCSTSDHDITLSDLFIANGKAWNDDSYPDICYMDENGGLISRESDLNKFRVFITFNGSTEEAGFDKEISKLLFKGASAEYKVYNFDLTLKLKNKENVQGLMHVRYDYVEPQSEDDNTVSSLALSDGNSLTTNGWWSIVDDIRVIDIFEPNKTHRQYNENTGGIDTVNNYKFVYLNKKNEILSEVSVSDITFGIKDFSDEGSTYTMSETIKTSKISDLWFTANTRYDADGVSFVAISNNSELEIEQRRVTFTVVVKGGLDGAIPLEIATRSVWPTKPLEHAGIQNDFPYINPSQNLSDDLADGKYEFYFDYDGSYITMDVRLTSEERDAFVASFTSEYGYVSNGLYYDDNLEFIKDERRLVFGQEKYFEGTDRYKVWIYKLPGEFLQDVYFNDMVLMFREEGYVVGGEIIHVQGLSEEEMKSDNIHISYYFEGHDMIIREPGSYEITAEIRYYELPYIARKLTATLTILPQ